MLPRILRTLSPIAFIAAAFTLIAPVPIVAQATSSLVTTRLTQPIDENSRITLKGTVSPFVKTAKDLGAAPDSMPLDRLTLVLKRSDAQESALKQLIQDMHTPGTASYHKWLTPTQFGKQFGPSDQDIATVEAWLQAHGFAVTKVNAGSQSIEISGNVSQFRNTFHAQIHKFSVNGETHYSNTTDPQIPTALSPVVSGFASLNNFRPRSYARKLGEATYNTKTAKITPQWTISPAANEYEFALSPGDYALQYDLGPLYSAGINGSGQTIAIVNESNINIYLVNQFRSLFNLPPNPPQVIIDGNDPGVDGINNPDGPNYASVEAYLDVEWSGAVAPNATVDLVIAGDTAIENGLYLALERAIYSDVAPVVSISFGNCEAVLGSTNAFISALYEQAAAQGQTVLVSTGDSGSAGCDDDNTQYYAVSGQAVSGFASTPYNVAVGGTDFYYSAWNSGSTAISNQLQTYWNLTASNNTPSVSIKGVIPEQPWNESQYGLNINSVYADSNNMETSIAGGSGGASNAAVCSTNTYDANGNCTGTLSGYPKPAWQTGTGVPSDSVRDIPDVSLFASSGINASFYVICATDGDCQPVSSSDTVQIFGVGGTSASTPSFAGIMALVNQKYGPQGQADFVLYPLAAQFPQAFHDVANGTNSVPCNITTTSTGFAPLDCISVSNPLTVTDPTYGQATEGQIGTGTTAEYNAGTGYDLATGLGTIDANVLVTNWGNVSFNPTSVTLTPSSTSFTHGASVTISGSVTSSSGTPTGDVSLETDTTEPNNQAATFFTLSNGSYSGTTNTLPGGTYNIWGQYGGDSKNGSSTSQKTSITVNPENSGVYFNIFSPAGTSSSGSITSGASIDYGTQLLLSAQIVPSSQLTNYENCFTSGSTCPVFGPATGTVTFADNGSTVKTAVVNAESDAEYNSNFAIGSHSVTASYNGDNSYNKSSAAAITFTVGKDTPQIAISAANQDSNGDFINGQPTVINVQVANGAAIGYGNPNSGIVYPSAIAAPTGTVTITGLPGGTLNGTLTPAVDPSYQAAEGVATVTLPASTAAGNYTATVSYSGDANYSSTSAKGGVSIVSSGGVASTTTATVTGSISPSTTVTITGTVTGQSGKAAPTGGILVYSSGYYIVELNLSPGSGDVSTFSTTLNSQTLFQGANFVTLQYTGDNTYNPSAYQLSGAVLSPLSDFSMVPTTTIVPVASGSSSNDTINLASVNGFAQAVTYTCTVATGLSCSITPTSTAFTSGSTSTATLNIAASSSVTNGSYNVLVTGKSADGLYVHTLAITAVVSGNTSTTGLTLSNSGGITVSAGSSGTSVITAMATGGFTGAVNLSCAVTTSPAGATSPPTCSFGHGKLNFTTSTTSLATTLTVGTSTTTTVGSYVVTVTGTDAATGKIMSSTAVSLTVTPAPDFTLTPNPTSISIAQGATTGNTSVITVKPSDTFTGSISVALTAAVSGPSGATLPTVSFNPSSVSITGSASGTSTITVNTTASTTVGTYSVTITGTSGSDMPTTTLTVIVTSGATPGFGVAANPDSGSITAGSSATTSISVTPTGGFTGNVALTCSVAPANGVTCSLSPTSVTISGTTAGTSTLTINTSSSSGALSRPLNKFFAIGGGATLAMLFFFGIPARRRSWRAILGMLILGAIVGVGIGCGSNGGGNNGGGSANYTVTVTGTSGTITQSGNVAITVNQ